MATLTTLERGAVYGVSGLPWCAETLVSAKSLKRVMPGLPLELHIDRNTQSKLPEHINLEEYFDYVEVYDEFDHWRGPKFSAMLSTRFKQNLYLDGDTFVTGPIDELFEVLEQFDITAAHAPQRIHPKSISSGLYDVIPPVPDIFPEFNAGVVSYRNNEQVRLVIEEWLRLFELGRNGVGYTMDQPAMRSALYHSQLRIHTLLPEYNLRADIPNIIKGPAKIIHAHGKLAKIAQHVNTKPWGIRIVQAPKELIAGKKPRGARLKAAKQTQKL